MCWQKGDMPSSEAFKIAAAGVGSIGFMNISLNLNSVGFYQITKLAIVPCTLVAQAVMFGLHVNRKIQISLFVLLIGLTWATVTDVHLNAPGFLIGVLAILTTTVFQIWQGSKQREFGMTGIQLQSSVAVWQALQALAAALALENLCVQARFDVEQDDKEPFFPRVQQGVQLHTDASIALRRVPTGAESHSCTFSDVSGTDEFEKRGK
ncbi:hypothetical protein AB1Y20_015279 [Prymnesium parvum]|uniref:Sugar phosphate transporter domain-containing protein n=1 Tax=Prymnesium parvum TaxID=97485 RepID=A0AB34K0C2_PRYPA